MVLMPARRCCFTSSYLRRVFRGSPVATQSCICSKLGTFAGPAEILGVRAAVSRVPSLSGLLPPLCDGPQGRIHTFNALKPHPHPTNPLRRKSDKLGTRRTTGPSQEFPQEKIPTPEGPQLRKYATAGEVRVWRRKAKKLLISPISSSSATREFCTTLQLSHSPPPPKVATQQPTIGGKIHCPRIKLYFRME